MAPARHAQYCAHAYPLHLRPVEYRASDLRCPSDLRRLFGDVGRRHDIRWMIAEIPDEHGGLGNGLSPTHGLLDLALSGLAVYDECDGSDLLVGAVSLRPIDIKLIEAEQSAFDHCLGLLLRLTRM